MSLESLELLAEIEELRRMVADLHRMIGRGSHGNAREDHVCAVSGLHDILEASRQNSLENGHLEAERDAALALADSRLDPARAMLITLHGHSVWGYDEAFLWLRSVYDVVLRVDTQFAYRIATGIEKALRHLGDNILPDVNGNPVANATAKRDTARDAVVNWMLEEGMEGRLRYNDECPHWQAYIEAEENLKRVTP